eukprot:TRINITY_DN19355_c0_g1_i3.p1 TRINITY_DN19355_c0_g1~~TRINITY_DN19355_c0_g1_i3.p1  ORF type:complete len:232 (+),score=24.13 TRINITY_DN19355_c0_g1_i3:155-850(+)
MVHDLSCTPSVEGPVPCFELALCFLDGTSLARAGQVNRGWRIRALGDNEHAAALWRHQSELLFKQAPPDHRPASKKSVRPSPAEIASWWAAKPGLQPTALAGQQPEEYRQFRLLTLFDRLEPCHGEERWACEQRMFKEEAARCENCECCWCEECKEDNYGVHDIECSQCPDYTTWCYPCFQEGKILSCDCDGTDSWHYACGRHVTPCDECGNGLCEGCREYHGDICDYRND